MNNNKKVWFITGASKGLGLALAKRLLEQGYRVTATSRNAAQLVSAIENASDNFLPLGVDLTNPDAVKKAIADTVEKFGQLDVIVNNAGYGMGGTVEEFTEEELQQSFSVNVFAPVYVMQAALPYMRKQRSGHIINISSIAGFAGATGWAIYAGTKSALTGLTEVLAQDLKELTIHTTAVAPGGFRTEFLSDNSLVFVKDQIDDYAAVHQSHQKYKSMDGSQAGDPVKAAAALIELAEMPEPPVRLFLGTDAYNRAKAKIADINSSLDALKALSFSTDF
ncbi:oxidoreductase [Niastella populi]|uniref:Short-chain dehydrogenase/reductase n=1 Tax=Niastella populi TaxID=550983 RepID=A0A1V9F589_9BACT|nr:oxidoreductase [Niastella populi]OQP53553.1 short-chain dehydrogenase/reductase [Niastella populi]